MRYYVLKSSSYTYILLCLLSPEIISYHIKSPKLLVDVAVPQISIHWESLERNTKTRLLAGFGEEWMQGVRARSDAMEGKIGYRQRRGQERAMEGKGAEGSPPLFVAKLCPCPSHGNPCYEYLVFSSPENTKPPW
jgi:hypothetical protein